MPRKKKAAPAGRTGKGKAGKVRKPRLFRRREPAVSPTAPPVEARALARYVPLSPQKARLVIDLIRGRNAGQALNVLRFTKKRAARPIEKVLRSAIANAEQKAQTVDVDRLVVKRAVVNEGPRLRRVRAAPHGRAHLYKRRSSHIEIAVAELRRTTAVEPAETPGPTTT